MVNLVNQLKAEARAGKPGHKRPTEATKVDHLDKHIHGG
jgi:hypothetical protein